MGQKLLININDCEKNARGWSRRLCRDNQEKQVIWGENIAKIQNAVFARVAYDGGKPRLSLPAESCRT